MVSLISNGKKRFRLWVTAKTSQSEEGILCRQKEWVEQVARGGLWRKITY